jgi:hypothetical protein
MIVLDFLCSAIFLLSYSASISFNNLTPIMWCVLWITRPLVSMIYNYTTSRWILTAFHQHSTRCWSFFLLEDDKVYSCNHSTIHGELAILSCLCRNNLHVHLVHQRESRILGSGGNLWKVNEVEFCRIKEMRNLRVTHLGWGYLQYWGII